jgi:hypothetical protein
MYQIIFAVIEYGIEEAVTITFGIVLLCICLPLFILILGLCIFAIGFLIVITCGFLIAATTGYAKVLSMPHAWLAIIIALLFCAFV